MHLDKHRPHLTADEQMRELVLLAFRDPLPQQCAQLRDLSRSQWARLLHWLDTSGLALYFLARLSLLNRLDWLPQPVLARLERNLVDNTERNNTLLAECVAIQQRFQDAGLTYAVLKGISLWPSAVPAPELRSQLDLDFLVAGGNIVEARQILDSMGYQLHAVSGRSWEFKTPHLPSLSIKDLYKNHPGRCVELHVETETSGSSSPLASAEIRSLKGFSMPVLAPVDLFLGQALHLYKHVCSESFRCGHMVEFRRAVLSRRNDKAFWHTVRSRTEDRSRERLAIGVVTLLATQTIGVFAPPALTCWTVDRLPASIRLWVEIYGPRCVYAGFPGSKLYLLLQHEMENEGIVPKRSAQRALLPLRLPPPIAQSPEHEPLSTRMQRASKQLQYILMRLRFHIIEGLRYAWESRRWQSYVRGLAQ
jgi:hypothetical protein